MKQSFGVGCYLNSVHSIHNYITRSAANQSYYLPQARTNYGIFNIHFHGQKVWNSLGKENKSTPFSKLKKKNRVKKVVVAVHSEY